MKKMIAILDDEPDRLGTMKSVLRLRVSQLDVVTFVTAPDTIAWLAGHLAECALVCLDHDLVPNGIRGGATVDPGTGREVVDYLAACSPTCPVIIHTTNALAAPGMECALVETGWSFARVSPYEDVLWIQEVWIDAVTNSLGRGVRNE